MAPPKEESTTNERLFSKYLNNILMQFFFYFIYCDRKLLLRQLICAKMDNVSGREKYVYNKIKQQRFYTYANVYEILRSMS